MTKSSTVKKRAKQEGVSVSKYIQDCIALDLAVAELEDEFNKFSGPNKYRMLKSLLGK